MTTLLQNRYELLEQIGVGGMSIVFKARCTLLDRIVAVKILKDEFSEDESFVLKFKSEAQSAARLSHPNIVNIYDVGEDNGLNFIVMEYIEGTNLKEVINQRGPLPPDEVIRISSMILDALAHAHDKGVIHRDIKPHNIIVTRNGTAKVADFGIARAVTSGTITYSGNMVGSVHYVSPEQARGSNISAASDLYSLGCVMYEMVTGRVPFDADSPVTVALKHVHEEPKPPSLLNEAVPRSLEYVIRTSMEKNPAYRFQSAQEMKQALDQVLMGKGKSYKKKYRQNENITMPIGEGNDYDLSRKKKRISSTGYIMIAIVILALTSGFLYGMRGALFGQEVVVPNIVGMSIKEASDALAQNGLELSVVQRINSSEVDKDNIVSQVPEANGKVKEGRKIEVILSLGPEMVEVPKIVGKSLEDASFALKSQGLSLGEVGKVNDPDIPEGIVATQDPEDGDEVELGSKIDITVSTGGKNNEVGMPNLVGMYLADARTAAEKSGLVLSIEKQSSSDYFPGQIVKQSITAGEQVKEGDNVSVVVSTGPGPLPKTAEISYNLPASNDYSVLSVILNDVKGKREIYNDTLLGGNVFSRVVEYYGKGTVTFYVDGQEMEKQILE